MLDCEDELWSKFKDVTTKGKTMNEAVVELIEERVKNAC